MGESDFSPEEIEEINEIAKKLAAEMIYEQLKKESVNYHSRWR